LFKIYLYYYLYLFEDLITLVTMAIVARQRLSRRRGPVITFLATAWHWMLTTCVLRSLLYMQYMMWMRSSRPASRSLNGQNWRDNHDDCIKAGPALILTLLLH